MHSTDDQNKGTIAMDGQSSIIMQEDVTETEYR